MSIKALDKISLFLSEVKQEMKRVRWPNRAEAFRLTLVVILVSTVLGIYIGGLDLVLTKLLEIVLR